jgi:transposase
MTIDTRSMVQLLFVLAPALKKDDFIKSGAQGNPKIRNKAWGFFFKNPRKIFRGKLKNSLKFTGVMSTDGYDCAFQFAHPLRKQSPGHGGQRKKRRTGEDKKALVRESYVTKMSQEEKWLAMAHRTQVVGIDPGKGDIIHAVGSEPNDVGKLPRMRLTRVERRYGLQTKKRAARLLKERKKRNVINGRSVHEHEQLYYRSLRTAAVKTSSLSLAHYRRFLYITHHELRTPEYSSFYRRTIFRSQAFIGYQARQRSEAAMLAKFFQTFGRNCIVVYGNWGARNMHMRHHSPTLLKTGVCRILNSAGYTVYLADEFNTSKACFDCDVQNGVCERFLMVRNPRLRYKPEAWRASGTRPAKVLCWGLTKCDICKKIWNRDTNAALNIMQIGINAITGDGRPVWLNR